MDLYVDIYNNITPLGFAGISYENLVFYNNVTPLGFYNDLVLSISQKPR